MLEQVKRSNECFTLIITDDHIHIKNMGWEGGRKEVVGNSRFTVNLTGKICN